MKTRRYRSAGGVIIDNGQMLLLNRPSQDEVRLPKGHIEYGESPPETALREVREEAGLANLEIIADLGMQQVEFDYDKAHFIRDEYYFLMRRTDDGTVKQSPKDAVDFVPVWKPLKDAVHALTYDAEKNVARRAIAAYEELTANSPSEG